MKDAADKEARIAMVNAEGFDFSEEDIKAVKSELSDDELDAVSGGVIGAFAYIVRRGLGFLWAGVDALAARKGGCG